MFKHQDNLKLLQQFANSIISLNAPGVDFTKTFLTIETEWGKVTYCPDNNIQLQTIDSPAIWGLTYLNKKSILEDGFEKCMENHLCGNYIHIDGQDIEWGVECGNFFLLVAYTEKGRYQYTYDFDFDFDANLNNFVELLTDFLQEDEE